MTHPPADPAPDSATLLITEIRALREQVALLQQSIVPRREIDQGRRHLAQALIIGFLVLLGVISGVRSLSLQQTRDRIDTGRSACVQNNLRGSLELQFFQAMANAPEHRDDPAFAPERLAGFSSIRRDCAALYPSPGDRAWPSFFELG